MSPGIALSQFFPTPNAPPQLRRVRSCVRANCAGEKVGLPDIDALAPIYADNRRIAVCLAHQGSPHRRWHRPRRLLSTSTGPSTSGIEIPERPLYRAAGFLRQRSGLALRASASELLRSVKMRSRSGCQIRMASARRIAGGADIPDSVLDFVRTQITAEPDAWLPEADALAAYRAHVGRKRIKANERDGIAPALLSGYGAKYLAIFPDGEEQARLPRRRAGVACQVSPIGGASAARTAPARH